MAEKPDRDRWYFVKQQLLNSPTVKCGIDPEKELSYRQQAANLIQDMGQRLQVFQLCINTSIVYMHRFYMYNSFTKFPRNSIAAACLFLAAKVEEQPHKLEHVIRVAHACLHRGEPPLDPRSNAYAQQAQELVINESIILQTLGFEVGVVHPHTHVVKCTQMIRASKDLSQSSYFLATNSLHLTTFCLKYKPTVVACVCIHLACKWTQWTIPKSSDGMGWWTYVDRSVTEEHLDELTREFLFIIDRCPTRLKKRIMGYRGNATKELKKPKTDSHSNPERAGSSQAESATAASTSSASYDIFDTTKPATGFDQYSDSDDSKTEEPAVEKPEKGAKEKSGAAATASSAPTPTPTPQEPPRKVSLEEYKRKDREKKEKEMQTKRQEGASGQSDKADTANQASGRPVSKDSRQYGQKFPGFVDKNVSSSKSKLSHGHEKLPSGQERVLSSHDRLHTGHDRIPSQKHLPGASRTPQGHEKIHSGQTRGPSGPERLHSSQERSSSGPSKAPATVGREHSGHSSRPGQEKVTLGHGMKPTERPPVPAVSAPDSVKHSSVKKEKTRPEIDTTPLSGKDIASIASEKRLSGSDTHKKDVRSRSHSQSAKGTERSDKSHRERHGQPHPPHVSKVSKPTHSHRTSEPPVPQIPQIRPIQEVKKETKPEPEQVTQDTLDMLNQLREEVMEDLEKERSMATPLPAIAPNPESVKIEPDPLDVHPNLSGGSQMVSPPSNASKPKVKASTRLGQERSVEVKPPEQIDPFLLVPEGSTELQESHACDRDNPERRREERDRRREGHKSKRDDKKHRHKHRHNSPSSYPKYENDLGEGSGDRAPAKKQRLEEAGSPHTVLTTSKGIKLKIKGLSNSFNNGSDHNHPQEPNTSSESPGSLSLKLSLKLNSSHDGSPRESSKERDGSNHHHHHHRSHHKHKSRHHRSKDGQRKRPRSPGMSSASDASPAITSPKRRTPEAVPVTKSALPSNQSLLNLPMPPKMTPSSRHASPHTKYSKRRQESNPPMPPRGTPPPPPPPPQSMQPLSTIDISALYSDFQPPLPSGSPINHRPPPPPPIPPAQKRPPLPP